MLVESNIQSEGVLDPNQLLDLVSLPHAGIEPDVMIHATDYKAHASAASSRAYHASALRRYHHPISMQTHVRTFESS